MSSSWLIIYNRALGDSTPLVPDPSQSDRNWSRVREGALSFPPARSKTGTKGPRPLVAMCLRVLADSIGAVDGEMIRFLPESLQWGLWRELVPRNISLHAWTALSCALHSEAFCKANDLISSPTNNQHDTSITIPMGLYRYRQEILNPPCELAVYTTPLKALDTDCLAHLSIDSVTHFEANELLSLAELPALAVLELNGVVEVSDRLIRGWSEIGATPFPKLRVLKIGSREHGVSEEAVRYVQGFSRLEIFDVVARPVERWRNAEGVAGRYGWKVTSPKGSCFESYADAYLDGRVEVAAGVGGLRLLFEDDRFPVQVSLGSSDALGAEEGSCHLNEGWRALLRGDRPSAAADSQGQENPRRGMSDNDAFWFMALLAQKEHNGEIARIQGQVAVITLQRERFVSLGLRRVSIPLQPQPLDSERLIFSRAHKPTTSHSSGSGSGSRIRQTGRQKERSLTDLKPRKRQKLGDMLSSFGMGGTG